MILQIFKWKHEGAFMIVVGMINGAAALILLSLDLLASILMNYGSMTCQGAILRAVVKRIEMSARSHE